MDLYAQRGIADWHDAPQELRKRASECLGADKIADKEKDATETIYNTFSEANAHRHKFIPMPRRPKDRLERCFFLPIRGMGEGGKETADFDLFMIIKDKNCLAFRFDASHQPPTTHGYGHVQMSTSLRRRTIEVTEIPKWLPDSYPAFPISTSDPLKMFLAMATAVHGYDRGVVEVLRDMLQKASRAHEMPVYIEILKTLLLD